jgi:hypothetical protein
VLANHAYWLIHHDYTGDCRTSRRAAGIMLAAALLGELVEAGAVGLDRGDVVALTPSPLLDPLGMDVVAQITGERRRHSAAAWLECLGGGMADRVGRRMIAAGLARPARIGLRRPAVVANTGDHQPAWVCAGLIRAIQERRPLDDRQLLLLRLVRRSSVGDQLFSGIDDERIDLAFAQTTRVREPLLDVLDAAADIVRSAAVTR